MSETDEIISSIKKVLSEGKPLSISQIAEKTKIDWRTAEHYLSILKNLDLVDELKYKNTRTFYYKDPDNYFKLPVKVKHQKLISTIYYHITGFCKNKFQKEPTKTQVYKIIWKIDKLLNLKLPIGWYRYGPVCVQVFQGNEKNEAKLEKKEINLIKETTEEYCSLDNIELQRKVYQEAKEQAYIIKEKLSEIENKEELNIILMDLVKAVPQETMEIVTDFVRTTLLLGWNTTRNYFDIFWKYVTLARLKESIKFYYDYNINLYLDSQIESAKKEIKTTIKSLLEHYMDSKYSQDKLYQRWVKERK
ncbi:MAG: helix-turn-helix transcriptional regulator [Candidatus Lokiarchaeota archaeon]|nr:helix-turn-helix transcriptional regulator [Candidatus Lokiarchaeota archaeon]